MSTSSTPGPGETFVWGKDKHTARALLEASARTGHEASEVRTKQNGFVVPDEVAEAASEALQSEPMPDDPDRQF